MRVVALLSLAGLLSSAHAEDPAVPSHPAAEAAIADAVKLAVDGKLDEWITKYCSRCHDAASAARWKAYQLKSASVGGAACLVGEDKAGVKVTRWRGDPDTDRVATAYIQCGDRLPVPVTVQRDAEDASRFWIESISI